VYAVVRLHPDAAISHDNPQAIHSKVVRILETKVPGYAMPAQTLVLIGPIPRLESGEVDPDWLAQEIDRQGGNAAADEYVQKAAEIFREVCSSRSHTAPDFDFDVLYCTRKAHICVRCHFIA
jgi:hypothetical protein